MALRIDAGSFKLTIVHIGNAAVTMKDAGIQAINVAGAILMTRVRDHASLTDHSTADLRRLDHPYARRHGAIKVHDGKPWVHTRTGAFKRAIRGRWVRSKKLYDVYADFTVAPHVKYVIQGTRVMLPRDIIAAVSAEPTVRKEMMDAVVHVLGKVMRAKAVIRFG